MCMAKSPPKPTVPAPPAPPPSEDAVPSPVVGNEYGQRQNLRSMGRGRSSLKVRRNFNLNIPTGGSGLYID